MLREGPLSLRAQERLLTALPERPTQAAAWLGGLLPLLLPLLMPLLLPLAAARREALVPPFVRLSGLIGLEVAAVNVVGEGL